MTIYTKEGLSKLSDEELLELRSEYKRTSELSNTKQQALKV
jgi:hypothetical protein